MKQSKTRNSFKQIICIIIVLVLCNFIIPNYSYAVSTEGGGSLLTVLTQMFCTIPDAVIDCLQFMFVSENYINDVGDYRIIYAPGTIFAGKIPAFDIDFINPGASSMKTEYHEYAMGYTYDEAVDNAVPKILSSFGYVSIDSNINSTINEINTYLANFDMDDIVYTENNFSLWTIEGKEYILAVSNLSGYEFNFYLRDELNEFEEDRTVFITESYVNKKEKEDALFQFIQKLKNHFGGNDDENYEKLKNLLLSKKEEIESNWNYKGEFYTIEVTYPNAYNEQKEIIIKLNRFADYPYTINSYSLTGEEYKSSASILQPVVATWYNALRRIALVGLLSVLVYIGIKIVLKSTSAKDKAKYKNMLKDWLVALCILFTLHYVMSITITVVDKINEVIGSEVIGEEGEDVLITTVRNEIARGENWGTVLTYVVIYCVLVVFTIIFSIQYLKRVIYLAFLTAIAPLITLTYPLDKIKDGKSQAFDMWLKDYIFFSLLQVLHLLLYYILVGSSMDLTNKGNWIYALVAIGFLMPAEKIMKKMFGFEKSNSMGALAAGATGAFVMNAMNKMSQGASKLGGKGKTGGDSGASALEGAEANTTLRTATTNPLAALTTAGISSPSDSIASEDLPMGSASGEGSKVRSSSSISRKGLRKGGSAAKSHRGKKGGFIGGVKSVSGKYLGPTIKSVLRNASGGFMGLSGAIIGASAKLSQGDLDGVITGALAGGVAGKTIGQGAVDWATNSGKEIGRSVSDFRDTWNEGALGEVEAANLKFDREFRKSSGYQALRDVPGFSDEKVQQMLDAGITDAKQMDKILKNNNKHPRKYSIDRAIAYSELAENCPLDIMYNNTQFVRYCQDRNIEISEEEVEKLRKCIIDFK